MVRHKSKKTPQPAAQPSTSGQHHGAKPKSAPQPGDVPQGQADCSGRKAEQDHGGISKSAFYIGLTLTLALGLYVGSLIPSLLAPHSTAPAQEQTPPPLPAMPPAPEAPARQQAAPAQVPHDDKPPLPPEQTAKIAALEQAVLANPKDAGNWTALGNLYFDANQPRKAVSAYERSLALTPDNPDVLTDLGIMCRELGEYEKAVAHFRRASAVNPGHENAMFNEGVVLYYDLKRKDEAMKAWQRLLAVNPAARAPDGRTVSEVLRQLP